MKPYSVEIFRPDFTMVGNANVNEVTYKEDYRSCHSRLQRFSNPR